MFAGLKREDAAFALAFDGIKSKLEIEGFTGMKEGHKRARKGYHFVTTALLR